MEEKKANLIGSDISSPLYDEKHKQFRWSIFKNKDPETIFDLFTKPQVDADNLTVFEHMKHLGSEAGVFTQYMKGATFMIPTPKLLDQVVQMIDKIQKDRKFKHTFQSINRKISIFGVSDQ